MDDTLDSIRPSCNINLENEMSYLFGRDPSILAYGQRPCISEETKKNLMSVYDIEESQYVEESGCTNSESQSFQTIKVYLRMKPFPKKVKLTQEQEEAYEIQNSTTLLTKLPSLDNNTSSFKRSASTGIVRRKFTFTHTFRPETTQLELFEQAVKPQMIDFLDGQNSTIMTYGTTNSGKSYTLQGTITSPGIIPRCLEFVFSTISPKSTPSYKPVNHCDVVCLGALERAQELEIKTKLLTFASMDKHQYINAYTEMQKLLQEESPIRPSHCIDVHYSVWVSFAEIYNEIVYDLLSNENQKKRTPLKLVTDAQGTAFIKGLKTICVNSGSEAYQVLMAGQYNLKVAATALNARSSRSHCIFTIKLLKYYVENDPNTVEVSTFAFCDLAGSERLKKTLNIGDRLREAQNINTSLLVLGRCLKTIHDGQLTKQKIEHVGPFRESKLTRLFQKALSGKEHVALIVNINPLPNLYIETQNVLNFAAIAKKIVLEQKQKLKEHKKKSRFSKIVTESIKTVTDWDVTELESEEWQNTDDNHGMSDYVPAEDYDEILSENKRLKDENRLLKSTALSRDLEIREEMADTYMVMMKECEAEWKNHMHNVEEQHADILQWSVKQIEDFYKQKLQQLNCHKRKRSSIMEDNVDDRKNVDELEIQNSHLTSKLVLLKSNMKELNETNQALIVEKNKLTFELDLLKKDSHNMKELLQAAQKDVCTDEETTCYIEELKSQLFAKQEQVKKLKVFLNEAKEEYISVTTKERETEYIIKEQEEELLEKQETINDLEADFTNVKICLMKKTKEMEVLDEKLENQNKQLLDYECKMQNMLEQIQKLKNDKLELLDEAQTLKKSDTIAKPIEDSKCINDVLEQCYDPPKDGMYQESTPNEEICFDHKVKMLDKSTEIDNDHSAIDFDPEIKENLVSIETENSALKEKLTQSTTKIQNLKGELDLAKVKLKEISDQISNLQINSVQSKAATETAEIGCQVDVEYKEKQTEEPEQEQTNENEIHNKSSQTIESITNDEITQTSFDGEFDDSSPILNELSKLTIKYDDVKTQYKEKCQMLDDLKLEASILRKKLENLTEESNTSKILVEEHKRTIELLNKQLSLSTDEKTHLQKLLKDSDESKAALDTRIKEYEQRLNETETELSLAKDNYNQYMEKLNNCDDSSPILNELSKLTIKYDDVKTQHKEKCQMLNDLNQEASILRKKLENLTEESNTSKILMEEYEQTIELLNKQLSLSTDEKTHLQKLLKDSDESKTTLDTRIKEYEQRLNETETELSLAKDDYNQCMEKLNNFYDSSPILNELSKLTIKYDDVKTQYKEKCQMLDDLKLEASILRKKLENLTEESNTSKILVEEYKQSIELLNKELSLSADEKTHFQKLIKDSDESKAALDTRVKEYEQRLNETEMELSLAKDDYNQCMEKLNALQAEFDDHIEKSGFKTKQILDTETELKQQIEELNKNLEICQDEKEHLQKLLDENNDKLLEFEDRLESAKDVEQEKDIEIKSLQQEMKFMIRRNDADDRSDKLMEAEMKNTIRELTETKEKLSQKEEYIEDLKTRIKTSEQNANIMELLQQSAQERQAENDRLRNMNQELKNSLIEKEREMEAFMKNRDEMVTKYETLVKNQQEELEKKKRVATKHQSKEKGYCENTSEDEGILKERRTRRPPKKYSPSTDDISVIELPSSEPKRSGKRAVLPPPLEPLSERKKNIRKKKLYVSEDESLQDIEPMEIQNTPVPSTSARSLRSRRR